MIRVFLGFNPLVACCVGMACVASIAADPAAQPRSVQSLVAPERPDIIATSYGVTRKGTPLPVWMDGDALNPRSKKRHLLLVGGLDGSTASVEATQAAFRTYLAEASKWRENFSVSIIPCANPDGWIAGSGPANQSKGNPTVGYPPQGSSYNSPTDPEAAYLWRWIGMLAPDLVVEIRGGEAFGWELPKKSAQTAPLGSLAKLLKPVSEFDDGPDLVSQLPQNSPANVGSIPAIRVNVTPDKQDFVGPLLASLSTMNDDKPSPARQEMIHRSERTPLEVATELSKKYGRNLSEVAYIPAVALIGRVRLGQLTNDATHLAEVEKIVKPYVDGDRAALPEKFSGSTLSGHLIFNELQRLTGKKEYGDLAIKAAEVGFANGQPRSSMPTHSEMSDAVFMGCPILAAAGRITGDARFAAMCQRHLQFMLKLNLRDDGIHQHSPLDPTAWGRGNGFPALGLAMSLSELADDDPNREMLLNAFRDHLRAVVKHQDPTGMWHQIVDHPESYRELSCTCMITYAMTRGIREGWLEKDEFTPHIEAAWEAIKLRIASDGGLIDVCTGTGKQKSQRDYFDRPAILGPDARGGAMALLVATEIAAWKQDPAR